MEYVVALLLLGVVVAVVVLRPLLSGPGREAEADERRAALEAAKEAKYREIRDAELDHRTGKLSEEDWREVDRELRAQAIGILKRLDDLTD
jgi:hypothetical protein